MATRPAAGPSALENVRVGRYVLGVVITVVAVYSQYVVPQAWPPALVLYGNLPGDLFVVYGVPIAGFSLLVGAAPLRAWAGRMGLAAYRGLGWYGSMLLLALVVTLVLAIVYESVDPAALQLLNRPNPALTQAAGDPWFWVGFSFVIGAVEEAIFRGWIYGVWESKSSGWVAPAVGSSVIFAALHLYYGTTYGIAAPLIFPSLFLLGFAFAATYHETGGNLVVVALLHGLFDASAFYYAFINPDVGLLLRYLPMLAGAVLALVYYAARRPNDGLRPI